jgi:thiosulfate/3-mercaptopyruvate sulfurtransferase
MSELTVAPEWLKERLGDPHVKIVDASWYLAVQKRDGKSEFLAAHIPGAVFFDIDAIADHSTDLPHMLPDAHAFAAAAGALGLSESNTVVVYDGMGLFTAPRVWWTLKVFGVRDVRVLDGGFPAWKRAGFPIEAGEAKPKPSKFNPQFSAEAVRTFDQVRTHLAAKSATVVDARSAARFRGEAPEPRPGLASGHMPGARNVPYDTLADDQGRLRPPNEIRKLFQNAGVDLSSPVVTSCGSGVTAAVLLFALASLGKHDVTLYDGSWTEWGSRPGAPVATGPA